MYMASYDSSAAAWEGDYRNTHLFIITDLFNPKINREVANWYFDWIYQRAGNEFDTLICWNWGIGNWRKWKISGSKFKSLPKITRAYLKKYEEITGEVLP